MGRDKQGLNGHLLGTGEFMECDIEMGTVQSIRFIDDEVDSVVLIIVEPTEAQMQWLADNKERLSRRQQRFIEEYYYEVLGKEF